MRRINIQTEQRSAFTESVAHFRGLVQPSLQVDDEGYFSPPALMAEKETPPAPPMTLTGEEEPPTSAAP